MATNSDIVVKRSLNFGESWEPEQRLTADGEGTAAHQGAYLAEFNGTMLAVWRRLDDPLNSDSAQSNAIMYSISTQRGAPGSWSEGVELSWDDGGTPSSEVCPFDQITQADRFRTLTFPVAVGSEDGFLVVWSDRGYTD